MSEHINIYLPRLKVIAHRTLVAHGSAFKNKRLPKVFFLLRKLRFFCLILKHERVWFSLQWGNVLYTEPMKGMPGFRLETDVTGKMSLERIWPR